ncbi:MAG TPA: Rne/Rng family ribonuclease [Gemmataceae bacterium]|jgi:ribonuclease E|nr:Rne/Rng family ribonuclease [Gemmataceae bacterium]
MKKEMLINVLQPEECRIAIVEDGTLEELYVERTSQESYVGNIYKGRIVNIEPSIQAAFVDFGIGRNGFLHVSDVDPAYYRHLEQGRSDRRGDRRDRGNGRGRGRREYRPPVEPMPPLPAPEAYAPPEPQAETPPRAESTAPPTNDPASVWGAALEILGLESPAAPTSLPPEAAGQESAERPTQGESKETLEEIPTVRPVDEELANPGPPPAGAAVEEADIATSVREVGEDEGRRGRGRDRGRQRGRGGNRRRSRNQESEPAADAAPKNEAPAPELKPPVMEAAQRVTSEPEPVSFGAGILESEQMAGVSPPSGGEEPATEFEQAITEIHADDREENGIAAESLEEPSTFPENGEAAPPESEGMEDDFLEDETPDAEDFDLEMDLEDGEVPQPRLRPRERRGRGDRGDRGGRRRMGGRPGFGRPKPLIQDIFKRGQEVIVQVIKEGIGTKGPTLSTYISIAGRYLVLMPGLNRIGVSRKIMDEEARIRLREILTDLKPPHGLGFIIRTAGIDRNKKELQNDLAYLLRLWQVMVRRIRKLKSPAEIYQESDMITRTIRDVFTSDIDTIWVDEPNAFAHAEEFLQIVMPRYAQRIKHYDQKEPIFHKYRIEEEITRIQQKKMPLPMGGSIVIEQTEALVAIDVNSGNFRADNNAEETAYQMNLQAAKEIARQLRLRDLGGVIVNDFIDMRDEKHKRGVERALRDALRRDRARTKILRISQFGLIEMTRQRIRPSLKRSVYQECPMCMGNGQVKTVESMSIEVMRLLQLAAHRDGVQRIQVRVHQEVGHYLLNRKRRDVLHLEETGQMQVNVIGSLGVAPEFMEITCFDRNGNELKLSGQEPPRVPERFSRGRR